MLLARIYVSLLLAGLVGCANPFVAKSPVAKSPVAKSPVAKSAQPEPSPFAEQTATALAPLRESWKKLSERESSQILPRWNWVTSIPAETHRAELQTPLVPLQSVAALYPSFPNSNLQLVSTHHPLSGIRIVNIGGQKVQNCADVYDALERNATQETLQVDLQTSDGQEVAVIGQTTDAKLLAYSLAPETPVLRVVDNGNPALVIRDQGINSKLISRVERSRGVLQVVLACQNVTGQELLAPREVIAWCDGQPLQCLTAAETLDRLYRLEPAEPETGETSKSFRATSSRDDYLIPTNYNSLCESLASKNVDLRSETLQPAFAVIADSAYPGVAVLGDARALMGILWQPQVLPPRDREKTGWIVFAGDELKQGRTLEVHIDFGGGMRVFRSALPAQ
jgi:hypothetical protein